MFDSEKLEKEKSVLIKELNYCFGKGTIFNEKINDYRIYATIQTLLNEWRGNSNNFDLCTEYEIKLHNKLTENIDEKRQESPHKVDSLTYKLMKKMFSDKYNDVLNENQKKIISAYISEDEETILKEYKVLKTTCLETLDKYTAECNNAVLNEKKLYILNKIKSLDENDISRKNLHKFLVISKLKEEILGEN